MRKVTCELRHVAPLASVTAFAPLSRQIPIPTLISPAMDGFLTTLASAAQIWPVGSRVIPGEHMCESEGRLNRRRTMGAIELRVLYIGHYMTAIG